MRTKALASQARASPGKPVWTSQTLPSSPCQAEGRTADCLATGDCSNSSTQRGRPSHEQGWKQEWTARAAGMKLQPAEKPLNRATCRQVLRT